MRRPNMTIALRFSDRCDFVDVIGFLQRSCEYVSVFCDFLMGVHGWTKQSTSTGAHVCMDIAVFGLADSKSSTRVLSREARDHCPVL